MSHRTLTYTRPRSISTGAKLGFIGLRPCLVCSPCVKRSNVCGRGVGSSEPWYKPARGRKSSGHVHLPTYEPPYGQIVADGRHGRVDDRAPLKPPAGLQRPASQRSPEVALDVLVDQGVDDATEAVLELRFQGGKLSLGEGRPPGLGHVWDRRSHQWDDRQDRQNHFLPVPQPAPACLEDPMLRAGLGRPVVEELVPLVSFGGKGKVLLEQPLAVSAAELIIVLAEPA